MYEYRNGYAGHKGSRLPQTMSLSALGGESYHTNDCSLEYPPRIIR